MEVFGVAEHGFVGAVGELVDATFDFARGACPVVKRLLADAYGLAGDLDVVAVFDELDDLVGSVGRELGASASWHQSLTVGWTVWSTTQVLLQISQWSWVSPQGLRSSTTCQCLPRAQAESARWACSPEGIMP